MTQKVHDVPAARAAWEESLNRPIGDLQRELTQRSPEQTAFNAGTVYREGAIRVPYWGVEYAVRVPGYECDCPPATLALLLYYLHTADGAPLTRKWVAFRDVPGGTFYHNAFQGYTGNRLAKSLGDQVAAFKYAAETLGGDGEPFGDAAYRFLPLPRVPLMAILWQADDEFEARGSVLFDASAGHYLPIDACAVLGSSLVQKVVRLVESRRPKSASMSTTPLTSME